MKLDIIPVKWSEMGVLMLDQRLLPTEEVWLTLKTYDEVAKSQKPEPEVHARHILVPTEDEAKKVLRRGVRLDEKTPGSGLGLDIVKELVDVYGGSLQLKRSVLGGLLAELRLPAARVL